MKQLALTCFFLSSILASVAYSSDVVQTAMYTDIDVSRPEVGELSEVYMGDRMLRQRVGSYRECIVPKNSYESRAYGFLMQIKANEPACKRSPDDTFYEVFYNACPNCEISITYGLSLKEKKGTYQLRSCNIDAERCAGKKFKNIPSSEIGFSSRYFVTHPTRMQRSIEYSGRNGDTLKFLYSEFTSGLARDAFTREFQIDFSKSDIVGFKGAILKIEEADNMKIVYSVIRNFPSE